MAVLLGMSSHLRTRWPEWALALTLLAQSLTVAGGRSIHNNDLYRVMRQLLDLHATAAGAGLVAVLWLIALVLNGTFFEFRRISPWVRVATATAASVYWTVWSVGIWKASQDYTSVAWLNYAVFAAMAAMCVFMAAGEVAHADNKARTWRRIVRKIGA